VTWQVRYTRTFLRELARLPANVRIQVERVAFGQEIAQDPYPGR